MHVSLSKNWQQRQHATILRAHVLSLIIANYWHKFTFFKFWYGRGFFFFQQPNVWEILHAFSKLLWLPSKLEYYAAYWHYTCIKTGLFYTDYGYHNRSVNASICPCISMQDLYEKNGATRYMEIISCPLQHIPSGCIYMYTVDAYSYILFRVCAGHLTHQSLHCPRCRRINGTVNNTRD